MMSDDKTANEQQEQEPMESEQETKPSIDPDQFKQLQESVSKLEAKNRELLEEKAKARKEAEKAAMEAAKRSGDIESLEKSWAEKLTNREKELLSELESHQKMIHQVTVVASAKSIAAEIALPGSADVIMPHVQNRLQVDIRDGMPMVRVLDREGRASAMTVDDLKKEFMNTPAFAPILVGSKASGSGSVQGGSGKGASTKKFDEYSAQELSVLLKQDPAEYQRIKEEYYAKARKF
jgi:outer membrane murein-binding lipoprotein Lpp